MTEIEVRVRQQGKPYLRVRLRASPATIGRDPEADVFLDSTHVSRVHARLFFDNNSIRIVDAGSTNGIRVDGVQQARADLEPSHTVTICDFAIRARSVEGAEEAADDSLSEGWVEDDEEEDDDEDTNAGQKAPNTHVGEAPLPPTEDSLPSVSLRAEDVVREPSFRPDTDIDPSVEDAGDAPDGVDSSNGASGDTNHAAPEPSYDELSSPAIEDPDYDADDVDAERVPDDVPAIISVMRNAEAQLETARMNRRGVVVEVLVSVGSRLHDVALVKPGDTYWWGDEPSFPQSLWTVPAVDRFPLVSHRDPGIYDVQVPQDSTWKMFHRGDQRAPTYRSGPLVGMRVAAREFAEVSYGPYTIYVRCVSAPDPLVKRFDVRRWIPKPEAVMAAMLAMVVNIVVVAMPGNRREFLTTPIPNEEYIVREIGFRDRPPEIPVPELTTQIPKEELATTTNPELATPTPSAIADEPVADAPPVPIRPQKRHKPDPNAGVTTIQAAQTPKQVSIGDFRVSGLLRGVPEPMIEKGKGPPVSSAAALLRNDRNGNNANLVDKSGFAGFNVAPPGRLDGNEVKMAINRHARDVQRCQASEPDADGRLDLSWVVEENGNVRPGSVRVVLDELRSQEMTRCVREAIGKWSFPQPKGGPAYVTFPFRFKNQNL
ncbi:MAG: AgmX/PglI C-terminal domain-containing protein [Myxococcota bacterium]